MDFANFSAHIVIAVFLFVCFFGSQVFSVRYIQAMGRIQFSIPFKVAEYTFLFLTFYLASSLLESDGVFYYLVDASVFGLCVWQFVEHRQISRAILVRQFRRSSDNKVNREVRRTILMVRESTCSDN
jgi:Na+-driven multidrug efflux pump